ncbi:MAG: hypothetical protein N2512_05935, partial [Armatimonadetes bacterium]|nr:hypothetical protein [Armatimonadota bacterium]
TVRLNMKELAPGLDLAAGKITLRALAAGSKEDLGEVPFTIDDGWLTFGTGQPGTGRYVASW